jgi:DNA-directed RNA polymerase specialized sigma24 family protein
MRDNLHCNCHICKVERHLFISLSEPPGDARFAALTLDFAPLARFTSVSDLLADLHAGRGGDSPISVPGEILSDLIKTGATRGEFELIQSILVLAFTPTIHRTYREVRAWFRELEPEDIAQQVLAFFLELAASAPVETLNSLLPIMLARSLRKNVFRWAERETRILLQREMDKPRHPKNTEPAANDDFESVSILNDFLDYCCHIGMLSQFERDLLVKIRIEGFLLKEIPSANPVLSARAVESRIQRILKRLQKVALQGVSGQSRPSQITEPEESKGTKNFSKKARIFSLRSFSDFLPISKSRRQLSLDSSPQQSKTKTQQFSTIHRNLLAFATRPKAIRRTRVISGAAAPRRAANQSSVSPLPLSRPTQSGESLPSNSDAGPARIIRKELAGNEKNPPKQICLPLAPARVRHILILPTLCISGICPGRRWLALGERRQRPDAGVYDHNRSRAFARLHCGGRLDFRVW